jgi:hypothetical protein
LADENQAPPLARRQAVFLKRFLQGPLRLRADAVQVLQCCSSFADVRLGCNGGMFCWVVEAGRQCRLGCKPAKWPVRSLPDPGPCSARPIGGLGQYAILAHNPIRSGEMVMRTTKACRWAGTGSDSESHQGVGLLESVVGNVTRQ